MERTELPIAVFDSGLGGISVLRALVQRLPGEDFLYFGDSANAPYGVRPVAEVRRLTQDVIGRLYDRGIKAAVIACNTATSAAIGPLRAAFPDIPVIGIEPALKPAVAHHRRVLVLATPLTLREGDALTLGLGSARCLLGGGCLLLGLLGGLDFLGAGLDHRGKLLADHGDVGVLQGGGSGLSGNLHFGEMTHQFFGGHAELFGQGGHTDFCHMTSPTLSGTLGA